jgi:hypothetical protein
MKNLLREVPDASEVAIREFVHGDKGVLVFGLGLGRVYEFFFDERKLLIELRSHRRVARCSWIGRHAPGRNLWLLPPRRRFEAQTQKRHDPNSQCPAHHGVLLTIY